MILVSLFIVSLILWNTYIFFQKFKDEERRKMEILAVALNRLNSADLDADIALELKIIENNHNIPLILTDQKGKILENQHLDPKKSTDTVYLNKQLALMTFQNQPITIRYTDDSVQYIYYKDSDILTNLKYYPLGLLLILLLFGLVIYLYNHSIRIAAQNQLWTGMAKETAHQIGTPLTSLMGWVTLLKQNTSTHEIADEVEKDVKRLEVIANRFSKIGSETELALHNIVFITKNTYQYVQSRSSQQVLFQFISKKETIEALTHPELLGWVIENVIKNAIDAMQGKGNLTVEIIDEPQHIHLKITDTGKGIPKNMYKKIFEPGFTTKKRGWGLGLSLSKRIVEDYHKGKIMVGWSEIGKGTCISLKLPKNKKN